MFKTFASALALTAALTLAAAPACAGEHQRGNGHGFGIAALAVGVIGAAIGASIASHSERPSYDDRRDYGSRDHGYRGNGYRADYIAVPSDEYVPVCPRGTHLGRHGNHCWAN